MAEAGAAKITRVIIIVQENNTVDTYFAGWLPTVALWPPTGR